MDERFLGEVIKDKRIEQGISQWNLCEGICDVTTLSRLENGKQTPKRNVINALLQRLGVSDDRFFAAVTTEEIRLHDLFKDITALNIMYGKSGRNKNIKEELVKKHNELKDVIEENDNIAKQLLIRSQVLISEESAEDKIEQLLAAIQLTHPCFREEHIRKCLFSFDEVKIINQIAGCYSSMGKHGRAVKILDDLLKNIDDRFDKIMPSISNKTLVLYNLSRELLACDEVNKAKYYAEEGKDLAIKYCVLINLQGYLIILADCEHRLGNDEKSKELMIEAYYLCKTLDDDFNRKIAEAALLDYYNLKI